MNTHKKSVAKKDSVVKDPTIKKYDLTTLRAYVKKFPIVGFPIVIRPLSDKFEGLKYTDISTEDGKIVDHPVGIYGMLPDTSQYYAIITLVPADVSAPFLTIYSKTGVELAHTGLFVQGCTNGPDILLCSATGRINKNLTLECIDSIKTVDLDEKHDPITGTEKLYIRIKKGRILADGTLELDEIKENIHNRSTYGWTE